MLGGQPPGGAPRVVVYMDPTLQRSPVRHPEDLGDRLEADLANQVFRKILPDGLAGLEGGSFDGAEANRASAICTPPGTATPIVRISMPCSPAICTSWVTEPWNSLRKRSLSSFHEPVTLGLDGHDRRHLVGDLHYPSDGKPGGGDLDLEDAALHPPPAHPAPDLVAGRSLRSRWENDWWTRSATSSWPET